MHLLLPAPETKTCSINRSDSNLAEQLRLNVRAPLHETASKPVIRVKNYYSPRVRRVE